MQVRLGAELSIPGGARELRSDVYISYCMAMHVGGRSLWVELAVIKGVFFISTTTFKKLYIASTYQLTHLHQFYAEMNYSAARMRTVLLSCVMILDFCFGLCLIAS